MFAGAVLGGLLAFLLFNAHPAKVFMGDTGSLFLGDAISFGPWTIPPVIGSALQGDDSHQRQGRWLGIPNTSLTIQPSDLAKLGLIVFFAESIST